MPSESQDQSSTVAAPEAKGGSSAPTGSERVTLTPEQLDAMMPPGEEVHTFMQAGYAILGAHWNRKEILDAARKNGAELSGDAATKMRHGAVTWDDEKRAVFIETAPNEKGEPLPPDGARGRHSKL